MASYRFLFIVCDYRRSSRVMLESIVVVLAVGCRSRRCRRLCANGSLSGFVEYFGFTLSYVVCCLCLRCENQASRTDLLFPQRVAGPMAHPSMLGRFLSSVMVCFVPRYSYGSFSV